MIEDKEIWVHEKAYLNRVADEIKVQLHAGINAADQYKRDAIELQKSMWEDVRCAPAGLTDLEDVAQVWQYQTDIAGKARIYRFSYEKVKHLKMMSKSPYFGRIDFLENGEIKAEQVYIGIYNLSTDDTMDILVYDWRAPISGMFYDFEIGPSSYACPAGLIEGEILLKRQYRIENAEIVYMFDSSLNINDVMLQEILGKSTDNRMRTIVTSIQKEQNTVIRNSEDRVLIVDGPAGSGKTSIALHRAAYLLYKYRETMRSENILIFSPNHVFEDYISRVLPELGEENILRSTFADFFDSALGTDVQIETVNQQLEYILTVDDANDIRPACIRFKSSPLFPAILKTYVRQLEDGMGIEFRNLMYNGALLISAAGIRQLLRQQDSRLPYANRLEKLRRRLFALLEQSENKWAGDLADEDNPAAGQEAKTGYAAVRQDIMQMTSCDILSLYADLFRDIESFLPAGDTEGLGEYRRIGAHTLRQLEQGILDYEDLAPVIYLKAVLDGIGHAASIKHVIIDEAQDYTAVQYEVFRLVFGSGNMTILGDVNQTVNGYANAGSFDAVADVFNAKGTKRISLTKSYRSSKELADFCRELLDSPSHAEQLNRHGNKPRVIKVGKNDLHRRVADDIMGLKNRGYKLIAVICKTASRCREAYNAISLFMDIGLISNRNEAYDGDVVVIPSYLAKGLEFDAVLAVSIGEADYSADSDRRLLYTVCTRALHELYLYHSDNVSRLVSGIDSSLYESDEGQDRLE